MNLRNVENLVSRWVNPLIDPSRLLVGVPRYGRFLRDLFTYSRLQGAEAIHLANILPQVHDDLSYTPFDAHYFYQDIWAARAIYQNRPRVHVDVGSRLIFVGLLTSFSDVIFVDIRLPQLCLERLSVCAGNILALPFGDASVPSLSCLHVAEHIGLGRYGDHLDPKGTMKAAQELKRVLAPGGNLFFSLPIGKPRVEFNAHRIHSVETILAYFSGLRLIESSGIDDAKRYIRNVDPSYLDNCGYGCGLFWFTKDGHTEGPGA